MNPLNVALIGTTGHGSRVAAPTVEASAEAGLVGGIGGSESGSRALAQERGLPKAFASVEELLADGDVDAVWICSPNYLHVAMAAAAGKHVLVEKPLAIRLMDAQAAAAADAAGR